MPVHLDPEDFHELEDKITEHGGQVTYDISEAKLVIGKVGTKRRAIMELRSRRLQIDEITPPSVSDTNLEHPHPPAKKRKLESEVDSNKTAPLNQTVDHHVADCGPGIVTDDTLSVGDLQDGKIKIVKVEWLDESLNAARLLPLHSYIVLEGKLIRDGSSSSTVPPPLHLSSTTRPKPRLTSGRSILERVKVDAYPATLNNQEKSNTTGRVRHFGYQNHHGSSKVALIQQSTTEYEGDPESDIPPPPDWVAKGSKYSCQRPTPDNHPNAVFVGQLKSIRLARTLTGDEVGVRAYSTSIAAIAAYSHRIIHPKEILRLPGCDAKIANLWIEWKNANEGTLAAVADAEKDETLTILRTFYDIWGVGAHTAREFLFDRRWRDLDDVIEHGWATLSRVQQIGVKHYDEFQQGIPRREVEHIASVIRAHATRVRDDRIAVAVVGGYRRGKEAPGDVDIIVSHRDLSATENLVTDLVASLEQEGYITHTLLLSLHNTLRGQSVLPFRAQGSGPRPAAPTGFDTLDKALVVWQDPGWSSSSSSSSPSPEPSRQTAPAEDLEPSQTKQKNPNAHRRVDIIISPWRTVGCAVAGWSGGTTFQRDLRRYAKNVKGWKFDSSGVRDRRTGEVVVLEGLSGVEEGLGWEDAEKKVFEGLGLEWIRPEERCTG